MLISSLIGKQIFTPEGTPFGYVFGALLTKNRQRLSHLACADGDENEFYLPECAVLEIGEHVTANPVRESAPAAFSPLPTGKPVYDDSGVSFGFVNDVAIERESVAVLTTENTRLPLSRLKFGDAVLYRPERRSKNTKQPAKRAEKKAEPAPSSDEKRKETPPPRIKETKNPLPMSGSSVSVLPQPERAPTGRSAPQPVNAGLYRLNLLGRKVNRDVYDGDGKLIARAGEKITAKILAEARRSNILLKLTVNTLTDDARFY